MERSGKSLRELMEAALARRDAILSSDTDAVRLFDGAGDGLPDVFLETFAGRWLLSSTSDRLSPQLGEWLRGRNVSVYAKRLDMHAKESPTWVCGPRCDEPFLICENGLKFEISFQSGYSQGIFLDQRDNRAELRRMLEPGKKLLNTFAYTGAFSVAAAAAGAETTTLDLSQPYLDWAKRNFLHSGFKPEEHHFCKGDTFHWLSRFAKQGRKFDGIVLDPPTFSRDKDGRVFRVEENFGELVALAEKVLAPNGSILCCTNFRQMTPREFEKQLLSSLTRNYAVSHAPMPADFTGEKYLKSVWLRS
jgi:23S rRNA (cytosine1962-C5)-methyltransferase